MGVGVRVRVGVGMWVQVGVGVGVCQGRQEMHMIAMYWLCV